LQPEVAENRNSLAGVQVLLKKCNDAKHTLRDIPPNAYFEPKTYKILGIVAKECDNDEATFQKYEQLYQEKLNVSDTELKNF
jgi:hypothetical protein